MVFLGPLSGSLFCFLPSVCCCCFFPGFFIRVASASFPPLSGPPCPCVCVRGMGVGVCVGLRVCGCLVFLVLCLACVPSLFSCSRLGPGLLVCGMWGSAFLGSSFASCFVFVSPLSCLFFFLVSSGMLSLPVFGSHCSCTSYIVPHACFPLGCLHFYFGVQWNVEFTSFWPLIAPALPSLSSRLFPAWLPSCCFECPVEC